MTTIPTDTAITTDTTTIKYIKESSSFEEGSFLPQRKWQMAYSFASDHSIPNLVKFISQSGVSALDKRQKLWQDIVGVKIPRHKILCQNINKP